MASQIKAGIEKHAKYFAGVNKAAYRREVSRLASIANKRIKRLENNKLTDSPAYQKLVKNGIAKFGVRGKDFNEVQSELSKINGFLNSQTSTIRGINNVMKTVANNAGISYSSVKELKSKTKAFFNIATQVEQYLRNVEDVASAIGYQKIWEVINEYVEKQNLGLDEVENDVDSLQNIVDTIMQYADEPDEFHDFGGNFVYLLND